MAISWYQRPEGWEKIPANARLVNKEGENGRAALLYLNPCETAMTKTGKGS